MSARATSFRGTAAVLAACVAIAGCIEFGGAYEEFCAEHPAECAGDGGTPGGGGAVDASVLDSGFPPNPTGDGGADSGVDAGANPGSDGGGADAGRDAGSLDAGALDAGRLDAGELDAGFDGGFDAGPPPCDPASRTLGDAGGPDICAYGEYCSDAGTCLAVEPPTCPQATSPGGATWTNPGGPVIYAASATPAPTTNPANECAGGDPAGHVRLSLYAPGGFSVHGASITDFQNHALFRTTVGNNFTGSQVATRSPPPTAGQVFVDLEYVIGCGVPTGIAAIYVADESFRASNRVCVFW